MQNKTTISSILLILLVSNLNAYTKMYDAYFYENEDKQNIAELDVNENYNNPNFYQNEEQLNAEWAKKELDNINIKKKKVYFDNKNINVSIVDKNGKKIFFSKKQIDTILGKSKSYTALTTKNKKKIKLLFAIGGTKIRMYLALNENTPIELLNKLSKNKNGVISSNAKNNDVFKRYKRYSTEKNIKTMKQSQKMMKLLNKIEAYENERNLDNKQLLKLSIEKEIYSNVTLYVYYNQTIINRMLVNMNISTEQLEIVYANNLIKMDFETSFGIIKNVNSSTRVIKKFTSSLNVFLKKEADERFSILMKQDSELWKIVK